MENIKEELKEITDKLLVMVNANYNTGNEVFDKAHSLFVANNTKKDEGHAGIGGGDMEYDYTDFYYAGLVWRFHWCNSGKKFVDVHEFS